MKAIKNVFFILSSLGLIALSSKLSGIEIDFLFRFSPMLMIMGIHLGLMIASFPLDLQARYLRMGLLGQCTSDQEKTKITEYFNFMGHMGLISGFLTFVNSFVYILWSLPSNYDDVGVGAAVMIRGILYAFIIRMGAVGIAERLEIIKKNEDHTVKNYSNEITSVDQKNDRAA